MAQRQIVAMGGSGFASEPDNLLLERFVLSRARAPRPHVCFVPTASGDSLQYVAEFYRAFSTLDWRPTDLQLFRRTIVEVEAFLLAQDVIYVGGGNTANMLAVWRLHGVERVLRRAWEEGSVLCGVSAGMICWFEQSLSASFGAARLAALRDGLGPLPGSACPHYDSDALRRPSYQSLVGAGQLADGWGAEDGAALVFEGTRMAEVVSSRPRAGPRRVERTPAGAAAERRLPARFLGA